MHKDYQDQNIFAGKLEEMSKSKTKEKSQSKGGGGPQKDGMNQYFATMEHKQNLTVTNQRL